MKLSGIEFKGVVVATGEYTNKNNEKVRNCALKIGSDVITNVRVDNGCPALKDFTEYKFLGNVSAGSFNGNYYESLQILNVIK